MRAPPSELPGVRVLRDGDLLAAVAGDMATARRAAALVTAEWTPESLTPQADWAALFRKTAVEPVEQPRARYPPLLRRGDVVAGSGGSGCAAVVGLPGRADRPRAARATRRDRRVERRRGHRAFGRTGAVPVPSGSRKGARRAGDARPHRRGGLRWRLWRQAAGRMRGGGGAAVAPGGRAGPRRLDAGGRVHLQLHAPGGIARRGERRGCGRPAGGHALCQLQQRRGRPGPAVRHRAPLGRLLPHAVRRPARQLSIARGGGEQLRARVAHGRMGRDAGARPDGVPPAQHHRCAAARGDRTIGRTLRLESHAAPQRAHAREGGRDAASA